jgi:peptidoglycan/LPS O-acetylase OafA/YrhL
MHASKEIEPFRRDINGLRAWGIVAVVLYHFGVPGFQGGFVGVDVFFVISGFLITRLVINGLDHSVGGIGFSLSNFYLSRVRRVVPALALLCAILLLMGWVALPATDYEQTAQHALTALGFFSNFKFWREAGYFDSNSSEKWLLHTWSLSIELQFYLLLPLVLMLLWRFWPTRLAMAGWLLTGFVASLFMSLLITPQHPGAAFYLLPTRAWEMLAGGLVFLVTPALDISKYYSALLEWVGLMLILGGAVWIQPGVLWPHWRALIPVMGTVLVLIAGRSNSFWTGTNFTQWLGSVSYSLYLWHWPVAVALVYLNRKQDPWAVGVALLAVAALGHLSWHCVEKPFRNRLDAPKWQHSDAWLLLLVMSVLTCSAFIYMRNGVAGRMNLYTDFVFSEARIKDNKYTRCYEEQSLVSECRYGGPILGAIVIGDSHAHAIVHTIERALPSSNLHVLDWSLSSCPTISAVKKMDGIDPDNCGVFVDSKLRSQLEIPTNVPLVLANRLSAYAFGSNMLGMENKIVPSIYFSTIYDNASPAFLAEFRQHIIDTSCGFARTRTVYLVRPIPELRRNVPRSMGMALLRGSRERISISLDEYYSRNRFVWEAQDAARAQCGVHILNPLQYLCSDGRCWGDEDGMPLYIDDNHLNERGAALLLPMFEIAFRK